MRRPAFVWHPDYEMDIGFHVFPTAKFRLVKDLLVARGRIREAEIEEAPMPTEDELLSVLAPEYLADLRGLRHTQRTVRSELPITREIINGCIRCCGGTIHCVRRAFEAGAACHFGGGFHHGFAGHGEGFCYVNDVAIGASVALKAGLCERVAVIDTDVHQGNGTAHIFKDEPRVFTFSIHQENLYPVKQESDLDIGLDNEAGDDRYNALLEGAVRRILADFNPQLVLYVAGADPFEGDQLGNLGLTYAGMKRRDELVLEPLARQGIPFVTLTAGGYARDVQDTVRLHAQTIEVAIDALSAS